MTAGDMDTMHASNKRTLGVLLLHMKQMSMIHQVGGCPLGHGRESERVTARTGRGRRARAVVEGKELMFGRFRCLTSDSFFMNSTSICLSL